MQKSRMRQIETARSIIQVKRALTFTYYVWKESYNIDFNGSIYILGERSPHISHIACEKSPIKQISTRLFCMRSVSTKTQISYIQ